MSIAPPPTPSSSPFLQGLLAPVFDERDDRDLAVTGQLPAGLQGMFVRNGPNPQFTPRTKYHPFDGDGMVQAFRFEGGVMFKSGVIAIFNAFGFQCVGFLRLGDGRILFYMRLHELGHDRHFILFLLHFGIKCRSVAERLPDKLTVIKHC